MPDLLTISELSEALTEELSVPVPTWKTRRVVDAVGGGEVRRAGLYRLVPRNLIPAVAEELRRTGWCDRETATCK